MENESTFSAKFLKTVLIVLFTFGYFHISAQGNFYYTYNDNKIFITELEDHFVVDLKESSTQLKNSLRGKTKLYKNVFVVQDTTKLSNNIIGSKYITNDSTILYTTKEVVVKFKENVSSIERANLIDSLNLTLVKVTNIYELYESENSLLASQKIYESGLVEFSHPNFLAKVVTNHIPNDEYFHKQYYLNNTGQIINDGHSGTTDADIDAPEAWNITKGDGNIIIAVIDQGVTSNHPDLPNTRQVRLNGSNFAAPYDGSNSNDPSPISSTNTGNNHGNACAGIIGATQDNNIGVSGIAPLCKIMPVRIPISSNVPATVYADAIDFAYNNGAHVISNSWGYLTSNPNAHPVIVSAIENAIDGGCVVVFSAGNSATHSHGNPGAVLFPASANIDDLIAVGASDRNDQQTNYSPTDIEYEIVAPSHKAYNNWIPGEAFDIWTIDIPSSYGYNPWKDSWSHPLPPLGEILPSTGNDHLAYTGRMGGTSAAAPQVAAAAALLLSVNPTLNPHQIKIILQNTADKVGGYNYNWNSSMPGHSKEMGYGRLNLFNAVSQALEAYSPTADLYIKDRPFDLGIEPNPDNGPMWISEDIWVRNQQDGIQNHENPIYNVGDPVYVYVRVKNKSGQTTSGSEEVKLHWAKAATALRWPNNWNGSMTNPTMGKLIDSKFVPILQPGEETILVFEWNNMPDPADYSGINPEPWHFCLLSRIIAPNNDPMFQAEGPSVNENTKANNNIAWKNITILTSAEEGSELSGVVAVGNFDLEVPLSASLSFSDDINNMKPLHHIADIYITMDSKLYQIWKNGNQSLTNIDLIDPALHKFKIIGNPASIEELEFAAGEWATMNLSFFPLVDYYDNPSLYKYNVIQSKSTGEIMGGEQYHLKFEENTDFNADAGADHLIYSGDSTSLIAENILQSADYNWYDDSGTLITTGQNITVSPTITTNYKLEVISSTGLKDYDEVRVEVKDSYIVKISPNPASNNVTVKYKVGAKSSGYMISIQHNSNPSVLNNYLLNNINSQIIIDVTNYPVGAYTVFLKDNSKIYDSKGLIIQ